MKIAEENTMSEAEKKFVELDRQKDEHKKFFDELREAEQALAEAHGVGHAFQDEQGIVYRVCVPKGTFVQFKSVGVERTRRPGEVKGDLSIVEAERLGFKPHVEPKTAKAEA